VLLCRFEIELQQRSSIFQVSETDDIYLFRWSKNNVETMNMNRAYYLTDIIT